MKVPNALHLWAGVVRSRTRRGIDKPVIVSAFGSDRDAVARALEDVTFRLTIDKTRFQQVTVTPGWGNATEATVLREEKFLRANGCSAKTKRV